jgi:hypothetical protein
MAVSLGVWSRHLGRVDTRALLVCSPSPYPSLPPHHPPDAACLSTGGPPARGAASLALLPDGLPAQPPPSGLIAPRRLCALLPPQLLVPSPSSPPACPDLPSLCGGRGCGVRLYDADSAPAASCCPYHVVPVPPGLSQPLAEWPLGGGWGEAAEPPSGEDDAAH